MLEITRIDACSSSQTLGHLCILVHFLITSVYLNHHTKIFGKDGRQTAEDRHVAPPNNVPFFIAEERCCDNLGGQAKSTRPKWQKPAKLHEKLRFAKKWPRNVAFCGFAYVPKVARIFRFFLPISIVYLLHVTR